MHWNDTSIRYWYTMANCVGDGTNEWLTSYLRPTSSTGYVISCMYFLVHFIRPPQINFDKGPLIRWTNVQLCKYISDSIYHMFVGLQVYRELVLYEDNMRLNFLISSNNYPPTLWLKWIATPCSRYASTPLWEKFRSSFIFLQFSHWNLQIWKMIIKKIINEGQHTYLQTLHTFK